MASEINDNNGRISQLQAALDNLQSKIDVLESNPGIAKAIVRVTPHDDNSTYVSGFNDLPGGVTPTVTRTGAGRYTVEFGTSLDGRRWFATAGRQNFPVIMGSPVPQDAYAQMIKVRQAGLTAGETALNVTVYDEDGNYDDAPFFLAIF